MNPGSGFGRVAAAAVRRPWLLIGLIVVLTGAGILAATRLDTNAGTDTLVDEGSGEFGATERFHEDFGDEPVIVLVEEDLQKLVLTRDLQSLFELETCLAGGTQLAESLPRREKEPLPAVCNRIAQLQPSRAVFGPATFLYLSVAGIQQALQGQIGGAVETARDAAREARKRAAEQGLSAPEQEEAGNAAAQQILSQFQGSLVQIALQYGITSVPRLDDPQFVSRVVFAEGQPRERRRSASATCSRTRARRRSSSGSGPTSPIRSAMTRSGSSGRRSPTRDSDSATAGTSSPERRWSSTREPASCETRC